MLWMVATAVEESTLSPSSMIVSILEKDENRTYEIERKVKKSNTEEVTAAV